MPVHFAGQACDMDAILEVARRRGIRVIEDAAHAIPTLYRGRLIGTIGDITCFSFYATKNVTTGEGGMLATDDDAFAERVRLMHLHGRLLLIHGAVDDNVHPQSSMQFAYELQKAGKPFLMMMYPRNRHTFSEPLIIKHMRAGMLEFIKETLRPGR